MQFRFFPKWLIMLGRQGPAHVDFGAVCPKMGCGTIPPAAGVRAVESLAASIPGLITVEQVKNAAAAVKERRQFETAEALRYQRLAAAMWQRLPPDYSWLRGWEWV